eukprot:CAMPEP_0174263510 /NCGR_PEP_ID=MMETSP0439-20130205/19006_1 /TAXON_ID=0 /ORGANISM="Stereomyxa ramosa, Strain Chinc5" /LENGTH=133 /DNA_ID=CAMNT_0015348897 /DNA_START=31 /DNA_END=432 /DNA_ORIENTATION=-
MGNALLGTCMPQPQDFQENFSDDETQKNELVGQLPSSSLSLKRTPPNTFTSQPRVVNNDLNSSGIKKRSHSPPPPTKDEASGQVEKSQEEEINFFEDMEPSYVKPTIIRAPGTTSRLTMDAEWGDDDMGDGWE